jgi:hypothetical protein
LVHGQIIISPNPIRELNSVLHPSSEHPRNHWLLSF